MKEYVEYGYLDGFVGTAGMVSFIITAFFFGAAKIPFLFDDKESTGMLSKVSSFYKLKKKHDLLQKSHDGLVINVEELEEKINEFRRNVPSYMLSTTTVAQDNLSDLKWSE